MPKGLRSETGRRLGAEGDGFSRGATRFVDLGFASTLRPGYGFIVGRSSTSLTNDVGAWVTRVATTWATSSG
jgi:hypothetical protein